MANELLRDFLAQVLESGAGAIPKKRLLRWMGRTNDTPSAWSKLLDEWAEVGGNKSALQGAETDAGMIVFLTADKIEPVENWT